MRAIRYPAVLIPALLTMSPALAQVPPPAPLLPSSLSPAPAPARSAAAPATPTPVVYPQLKASQRDQLLAFLRSAARHGLAAQGDQASAPSTDAALIAAVIDEARALHSGRLAEADFIKDWGLKPTAYDPGPQLAAAISGDRIGPWLADLPPPYQGYDNLEKALARYRKIADAGGLPTLAAGPDMTVGATGARVAALRRRLAIEDDQVVTGGDSFDDGLLAAVRRAQGRYGLNPTGVVGAGTLAALNVPVATRIAAITANMERWRWLPRELPARRIQVNIAAAVMTVFDGDAPAMSMRAVTGRPGDETPMLSSEISSIVINPPWNVPTSIATKELWPKEKAHPGYLKRSGFKVIPLPDGGNRLQQSSEKSALGHFKFDFPNPYAVYLHDTPTRATFSTYSRLASHGCVRLEKPADLAERLLEGDDRWSRSDIDAAVTRGDTVRAPLPQPIAVYILYWSAFAGANGQASFRGDPYGWDGLLASKVEARGRAAATEVAAR